MRKFIRSALVVLLFGAIAAPLAAQDIRPMSTGPERSGFWWGVGLGAANGTVDCGTCSGFKKETFPMLGVRLGGTVSPSFLIGAELTGGQKSDGFFQDPNIDENIGNLNVSAYFYPSAGGNFWLQGGLAGVVFEAKQGSSKLTYTAGGLVLGLGYDFRFGRNASITPSLQLVGGAAGNIKDENGALLADDFKLSYVHAGVSILWH